MTKSKSARPRSSRRIRLEFAPYSDERRSKDGLDYEIEDRLKLEEGLEAEDKQSWREKSGSKIRLEVENELDATSNTEARDQLDVKDKPEVGSDQVAKDAPAVDYPPGVKDQWRPSDGPELKGKLEVNDKPDVAGVQGPGSGQSDRNGDNCGCSHEHLSQSDYGPVRLKGVEYGVKGVRYDEASVDPTPIDIASTKECFLAVGHGAIRVSMSPIGATVLYGPSAAWYMAAANRQDLVLQQPLDDLEIKKAAGTFEIVGDNKIVYASNLDMQGGDSEKYSVTSVLCMEGALEDRDKDGYVDSFNLDVVTGRVAVAMATEDSYVPLISNEYCFELKSRMDILSGYGARSAYAISGKRRVGVGSAFKSPTQSIAKQPGYAFPVGAKLSALDPFIQSHTGEISDVYYDWVQRVNELVASGSGSSLEVLALDCALLML